MAGVICASIDENIWCTRDVILCLNMDRQGIEIDFM